MDVAVYRDAVGYQCFFVSRRRCGATCGRDHSGSRYVVSSHEDGPLLMVIDMEGDDAEGGFDETVTVAENLA